MNEPSLALISERIETLEKKVNNLVSDVVSRLSKLVLKLNLGPGKSNSQTLLLSRYRLR